MTHSEKVKKLISLRDMLNTINFTLEFKDKEQVKANISTVVSQLSDYIIPRAESSDSPLLTVVGGSTGAGKSIIIGALGLILGERADSSVLVNKEKKMVVEGVFVPSNKKIIIKKQILLCLILLLLQVFGILREVNFQKGGADHLNTI